MPAHGRTSAGRRPLSDRLELYSGGAGRPTSPPTSRTSTCPSTRTTARESARRQVRRRGVADAATTIHALATNGRRSASSTGPGRRSPRRWSASRFGPVRRRAARHDGRRADDRAARSPRGEPLSLCGTRYARRRPDRRRDRFTRRGPGARPGRGAGPRRPHLVEKALAEGKIPVVAPLAAGPLNVNADEAAAALAVGLGAERLLFVTDVPVLARVPSSRRSRRSRPTSCSRAASSRRDRPQAARRGDRGQLGVQAEIGETAVSRP